MISRAQGGYGITVLVGAGFSRDAEVPTTNDMVEQLHDRLKASQIEGDELRYFEAVLESYDDDSRDIERILESIEFIIDHENIKGLFDIKEHLKKTDNAIKLRTRIRDFIREVCMPGPEALTYLDNFWSNFGGHVERPIKIFSLNYDTCIEVSADQANLTWTDGFAGTWDHERLFKEPRDVYLFKLHGSVSWYRVNQKLLSIPLKLSKAYYMNGTEIEPIISYPGNKLLFHLSPYWELHDYWQKSLKSSRLLFIIGYSFRDKYINDTLDQWIHEDKNCLAVIVNPDVEVLRQAFKSFMSNIEVFPFTTKRLHGQPIG